MKIGVSGEGSQLEIGVGVMAKETREEESLLTCDRMSRSILR